MEEIVTILSTREWAITIWGTGFFIWMLTQSEIRKSLWNVIKILLGKNLRRFFLIIALYVAGITMIFYQLPFWNNIYLKDIILWLIFSGISYCVNSIIKGDTEHLKSTVKDNFRVIVIFEYFIGTFRFDVSNGEEPDFLTADITDYIECRPFLASEYDEKPYMPGQRYDDKLDDYCFATPGIYLIPLYLLVGSGSKDDKLRKKRLLAIIKRMRDQITESISTYHFNLDVEAKQEFAFSIIIDSLDRKKYSDASDKDEKFESLIIEKAELWEDYFQKYLYSCIEKMKLNKIEMPEGSRARAIDIYENMNMGGLSLSTLDLVAARVAMFFRNTN